MKKEQVPFGELVLLVGTRVLAGVGIGLLVSEKLPTAVRRAVGITLLAVGVISTVPLAIDLLSNADDTVEIEGGQ